MLKEADYYKAIFPQYDVIGLDYKGNTPLAVGDEIDNFIESVKINTQRYSSLRLALLLIMQCHLRVGNILRRLFLILQL